MTTTAADLRLAQRLYIEACQRLDLIPPGMHVVFSDGSKVNGIAYRVALTGDRVALPEGGAIYPKGSGHRRPPIGDDFLGFTKAEAELRLRERVSVVWDLNHAGRLDLASLAGDDR